MKYFKLIKLFIFFLVIHLGAQKDTETQNLIRDSHAKTFHLGPKAGLHLSRMPSLFISESDLNFSEKQNKSTLNGHFGLCGEFRPNNSFSLQLEIRYSKEGGYYSQSYTTEYNQDTSPVIVKDWTPETYKYEEDYKLKLDYLSMPLMAKYYLNQGLNIQAGVQLGYILNNDSSWRKSETLSTSDPSIDNSIAISYDWVDKKETDLASFDLSWCIAIEYKFSSGLNLTLGSTIGHTDLNNSISERNTSYPSDKMTTMNFSFSIGYDFIIFGKI